MLRIFASVVFFCQHLISMLRSSPKSCESLSFFFNVLCKNSQLKALEYVICFVESLYIFNFFNRCRNIQIFYYISFGKMCFSGICLFHYIFKFISIKFFIILSYLLNTCRISTDILFLIPGIVYLCCLSFSKLALLGTYEFY